MKLTTKDFDQASFNHKRTIQGLLWTRKNKASATDMDVSYRDMIRLHVEHKYYFIFTKIKQLYIRFREKNRT